MKWVKTAIGAVIAITMLGLVAGVIVNLTQEKVRDEVVTFEVLTFDELTSMGTIDNGTFNDIQKYSILEEDTSTVANIKSFKLNDINSPNNNAINIYVSGLEITNEFDGNFIYLEIYDDDTIYLDEGLLSMGDTFEITFEVTQPPQLTGVEATLIMLVPLIMVSGVLYYIYPKKEGE